MGAWIRFVSCVEIHWQDQDESRCWIFVMELVSVHNITVYADLS